MFPRFDNNAATTRAHTHNRLHAGATGDSDQRNQKSTSRTAPAPVAISKPRVVVTRAQALSALHKMEEIQGKRAHIFNLEPPPSVDEDSVFNQLSIAASGSGGGGGACGTGGSDDPVATPTNFDVMFDAAAAMTLLSRAASPTGQTGTRVDPEAAAARVNGQTDARHEEKEVGIEDLLAVMEEGVSGTEGTGSLGWGWLSAEEAGKRSKKLYRKAAHAQVRSVLLHELKWAQPCYMLRHEWGQIHETHVRSRLGNITATSRARTRLANVIGFLGGKCNGNEKNGRETTGGKKPHVGGA